MAEISEHEQMRRGLWADTFMSVMTLENMPDGTDRVKVATTCADRALVEFDKRFKKPEWEA